LKTLNFDVMHLERVLEYLSHNYSAVLRKISRTERGVIAVFIHEEYVFRTSSYQTLTTIVESQGNLEQATVTVVGSGGGEGICNFNWGSQSAGEDTILKNIQDLIKHESGQYGNDYWNV
jgi:hypothetical protein